MHSPLPLHSTIRLFTPVEQDTEHFEKKQKFDGLLLKACEFSLKTSAREAQPKFAHRNTMLSYRFRQQAGRKLREIGDETMIVTINENKITCGLR